MTFWIRSHAGNKGGGEKKVQALSEENLSLNKYCPPTSFKTSKTAKQACSQKSSVMESPQTRLSSPAAGEPGRLFMRPKAGGAARRALPALHNYGVAWQHPSPTVGHALCSEAQVPKSFPCVSILMRASPPFTEFCLVWSECTWERFTDTLAVRSTAWRCVRSTRPEEPATSFAFLQPLPSTRFQPITENTESLRAGQTLLRWSAE